MSVRFAACVAVVLDLEGGYADNPDDPGGATNRGITRRTLADWRHVVPFTDLPKSEVRDLGQVEAKAIYRARYWLPVRAGELPPGLDLAVFDFAVNSGPGRAVQILQQLVGTAADGLIGPKTLTAVDRAVSDTGSGAVIDAYCARRLAFLERLPTFNTFGRGWRRRIETVRSRAAADAKAAKPSISRSKPMTFLDGYKTYIIAASMLVAGIAQIAGVQIPGFEGQSSIHMIMEALAVLFLRRGIKTTTS